MKRLSLYLFLILFILQTPSHADDIRDFQIGGMSVGDSLLDYMSEEEIKESVVNAYPDKKFAILFYKKSTKNYDWGVGVTYKSNDKKYKIYGVQGRASFENIGGCYEKQDEIEKEISLIFDKDKKKNWGILKLHLKGEATEGSTYKPITFDFNNGDRAMISCYYYHDNSPHLLKISMFLKELNEYLESPPEPANN